MTNIDYPMRVGQHYGVHLYLSTHGGNPEYPDAADVPAGTAMSPEIAAELTAAWNLARSMKALGEKGFHCCSDTDHAKLVQAAREAGYLAGRNEQAAVVNEVGARLARSQTTESEAMAALAAERNLVSDMEETNNGLRNQLETLKAQVRKECQYAYRTGWSHHVRHLSNRTPATTPYDEEPEDEVVTKAAAAIQQAAADWAAKEQR